MRQLEASEVDVYRSIRLRALECDAAAFESTYEHETSLDVFPANTGAVALYQAAGIRPVVADDAPTESSQSLTLQLSVDRA